mmetsp:Transcript_2062/g.4587  ORF Transcript_2062/g.4587 Transcript_2062/m.4587 type:complete len:94 (+) Transcript_2062:394-675(+)
MPGRSLAALGGGVFTNASHTCTPVETETETEAANDAAARPAADTAAALHVPADKRTRLVLDSPSDAARRLLRRLLPVEFIGYAISCGRAAALS